MATRPQQVCGSTRVTPQRGTTSVVDEQVLYLPIRELALRIRERKLSPVELAEAYLERSERIGPKLNAYATLTRDLALNQARAAEREIASGHYRGPLHGIPYAPKDLVAAKGYPIYVGRAAIRGTTLRLQRHHHREAECGRRRDDRQGGDDRTGRWARLHQWRSFSHRTRAESLAARVLDLRFFERFGRGGRSGPRGFFNRLGYARVHHLPYGMVRRLRNAPELRPREPARGHGHCLVNGQAWPHGANRR